MKSRFHTILPTPKATTKAAVILFLDSGNCVHIQFKIGTDPNANIDPGIMIEKITKVSRRKQMRFTNGARKKINEHTRSTNSYPYRLHKLVAKTNAITIGITETSMMKELVCCVMGQP